MDIVLILILFFIGGFGLTAKYATKQIKFSAYIASFIALFGVYMLAFSVNMPAEHAQDTQLKAMIQNMQQNT